VKRAAIKTSSNTLTTVPAGYRMPAEWEPHAATWLAWPHYHGDWPGKFEPIPWVYAEIIRSLAKHERVELIVNHAAAEKAARRALHRANALSKNVRFHRWPTNRVWTRDSGCIFLTAPYGDGRCRPRRVEAPAPPESGAPQRTECSGGLALKFRFNAWAKYSNWQHDEQIGTLMAEAAGARRVQPFFGKRRIVLEGGSIDVNGHGTLLTTEECLLSKVQQRNPGMKRADYEQMFAACFGANHVIWLGRGVTGDDTHGHVDDITRFVSSHTVITMVEANRRDPNHQPLADNLARLRRATDQDGRPLQVVEIPLPGAVRFDGRRLPASYANFYIANGVVLVPVFNDPKDRIALNTLSELFPSREIVPIYSGDLIWGFGAMHCMTQQQPE
jgi:agmatine deiminase